MVAMVDGYDAEGARYSTVAPVPAAEAARGHLHAGMLDEFGFNIFGNDGG